MKKNAKRIFILIIIALAIIAIYNIYNWIVCGNQKIKINTANKAYTNSDLYISIIAQEEGRDIDTETKYKLLDSNGKQVENVKVTNEKNNSVLSIPDIEAGNYFIEAEVSSKLGRDTIKKQIYLNSRKCRKCYYNIR